MRAGSGLRPGGRAGIRAGARGPAAAIDGRTRLVALLGDPVAHSLSPALLNDAFAACGIPWVYVALPVTARDLGAVIRALAATGAVGANVTAPHKSRVVRFADHLSPEVLATGAANTLSFGAGRAGEGAGAARAGAARAGAIRVRADATDGAGFLRFLDAERVAVRGRRVVVAGSGGAARSLLYHLTRAGARASVLSRRPRAAGRTLAPLLPPRATLAIARRGGRAAERLLERADLFVNATPLGARPRDPLPIDPRTLPSGAVVVDLLYAPRRSRLVLGAEKRGLRALNGLGLLVHQAGLSFEIWTGLEAPIERLVKVAARHVDREDSGAPRARSRPRRG